MTKKKISYQEAANELENIVNSLEQGDLNIDEMAAKVKKANTLLEQCKQALYSIEEEVSELMENEE